jgi:hypothetical protein
MRRLIMLVVSASLLAGLAVVVPSVVSPSKAPQAQAQVGNQTDAFREAYKNVTGTEFFHISINRACVDRYGSGAHGRWWSINNPNSWGCYRWNGGTLVYLGGLDLNAYCRRYYGPNSWAQVVDPWLGVYGWSCLRNNRGGWA